MITVDFFDIYAVKTSVCIVIFCTLLWIYKKFDRNSLLRKGLSGTKIEFFNIVGHFKNVSHGHLKPYPQTMYFLQMLMALQQLHLKGGHYLVWIFNVPFVILYKANFIEALNHSAVIRKSSSYDLLHPWLKTGLLTSWGSKWKARRKLLTPSFHFDILKDFLPVINEQSQVLVQIIEESINKEWVDAVDILTLCSLDIICATTLGVSINAQRTKDSVYVKAISRATESILQRSFNPLQWIDFLYYRSKTGLQFLKDVNTLHAFTKEAIQKKKLQIEISKESEIDCKRKALLDLLLDYHMTHEDFTEEHIQEEVDTFAFEGHDTTSMGLSWSLYLIGLYPAVQKAIHEELDRILPGDNFQISNIELAEVKYLERVIKESLRLYPPVPIIARQTEENITLCDFKIPRNTQISQLIFGLHRDPDIFPNPEIFDPDRFLPENTSNRHPYAYIPFAAGSRNCIGQRFAMMELKTVLATVLKYYEVKSLDTRDKILPCLGLVLRPSHPIRLKFSNRET